MDANSPRATTIDFEMLGIRIWVGKSGQRYRELSRVDSSVQLGPEYPVRGERTMTIPVAMLRQLFVEADE